MIHRPDIISQHDRLEAFEEAVAAQPAVFERTHLLGWFDENAPWVEELWIDGRIVADTVNDRGRQHIPGPRDLLFGRSDGRYERYDPAVHGWWTRAGRPVQSALASPTVRPLFSPPRSIPAGCRAGFRRHHRKAG
jgi:hypothetical protein